MMSQRNEARIEVKSKYKADVKIAFEVSGTDPFPGVPPGCPQHAFWAVLGAFSMTFWRSRVPPGDPLDALCLP